MTPEPFEYFKKTPSENERYLDNGVSRCQYYNLVKKLRKFSHEGHLEFWAINWHENIKLCSILEEKRWPLFQFWDLLIKHLFTVWRVDDSGVVSLVISRELLELLKGTFWEFF